MVHIQLKPDGFRRRPADRPFQAQAPQRGIVQLLPAPGPFSSQTVGALQRSSHQANTTFIYPPDPVLPQHTVPHLPVLRRLHIQIKGGLPCQSIFITSVMVIAVIKSGSRYPALLQAASLSLPHTEEKLRPAGFQIRKQRLTEMAAQADEKFPVCLFILNQGTARLSILPCIPDTGPLRIPFHHLPDNVMICPLPILKRTSALFPVHRNAAAQSPDFQNPL